MHLAYTDSEEALRSELRAYYDDLLDDETRRRLREAEGIGPVMRRVVKQMGADGWLGIGWPREYGGQGRGPIDQFIFFDESMRSGAPVPMLTINSVAPTIMQFGSEEQKQRFLPGILRGELHFCIGYSEPGAGTDLASLRTRAVRDGDDYVVTGQKMWTSLAGDADYCWLAARTGDEGSRHRGISLFIAPMDAPGIERTRLDLLSSHDIHSVYWDDVRIPAANLVGGENEGWKLIVNQLNHERVTLCSPGMAEHMLHETVDWARTTSLPDGRRVIDQEWVRLNLAEAYAGFEFLRLANWKVAWAATRDELPVADASTIKVFGTEHYLTTFRLLMEVIGERAYLTGDTPGAVLGSRLEQMYRSLLILTFGGGTNELQRDLIAAFGMGMPMAKR
ncbi:MAG TPA: acyl-CoA dehydrogenase family protein [Acidimicrobiales bacterium]|nr:acyl-CoA dehydrogenase family protein [Acidimicrobiales bacterium]